MIARAPAAIEGDLPEETVLLRVDSGAAVRLNRTGAWLWAQLEEPLTVGQLGERLADRHGIEPEPAPLPTPAPSPRSRRSRLPRSREARRAVPQTPSPEGSIPGRSDAPGLCGGRPRVLRAGAAIPLETRSRAARSASSSASASGAPRARNLCRRRGSGAAVERVHHQRGGAVQPHVLPVRHPADDPLAVAAPGAERVEAVAACQRQLADALGGLLEVRLRIGLRERRGGGHRGISSAAVPRLLVAGDRHLVVEVGGRGRCCRRSRRP